MTTIPAQPRCGKEEPALVPCGDAREVRCHFPLQSPASLTVGASA